MTRPVSDGDWFGIREAARCLDFDKVARMADELGWPIIARNARKARYNERALEAVWFGLLLDKPDAPDPFWSDTGAT